MLSRIGKGLLPPGRQGVERRIPVQLLEVLALTGNLSDRLGVPVREAFMLARALTGSARPSAEPTVPEPGDAAQVRLDGQINHLSADSATFEIGGYAALRLDRAALRREIELRVASAIETVVRPRRGRPRRRD
jgi:hypothetical protein